MPLLSAVHLEELYAALTEQPDSRRTLYRALRPDDSEIREEELRLLSPAIQEDGAICADLCLIARERDILLAGVQENLSQAVPYRLTRCYRSYMDLFIRENRLNPYTPVPIQLPKPEIFLIYLGDKTDIPDHITCGQWGSGFCARCTVLDGRRLEPGSPLALYSRFCQEAARQRKTCAFHELLGLPEVRHDAPYFLA